MLLRASRKPNQYDGSSTHFKRTGRAPFIHHCKWPVQPVIWRSMSILHSHSCCKHSSVTNRNLPRGMLKMVERRRPSWTPRFDGCETFWCASDSISRRGSGYLWLGLCSLFWVSECPRLRCGLLAVQVVVVFRNLRRYGLEKFLLLDQYPDQLPRFRHAYRAQICGAFKLLKQIIFPCFIVKAIHEVWRIIYIHKGPLWENVVILAAILISWFYLTTIFLFSCILFNLVCNLQIIHIEDYAKLLEGTSDISLFLKEHMRLRYQLYKISHRFRIYIVLSFLVVTASQFITLFETTNHRRTINFLNAGDFVVSSIVQLLGVLLCLRGAAKVTHRAQGIASIASKWHALATCSAPDASESNEESSTRDVYPIQSLFVTDYESDLESEDLNLQSDSQLASQVVSYHKRQALVMYFQLNPAGITIFGFNVDRAFINTIFFIELSLVLWILGKTIVAT